MFITPAWPAPATIRAYSSLRQGGLSSQPYQSFNLAFHVGDQEDKVLANRKQLHRLLDLPTEPIWLQQVHGNTTLEALPQHLHQEADSSYTRQANQVCAIMTADCLPLLVCNQEGTLAAAIHAGWRGLAKGVIENTLRALRTDHAKLLVWLGPAIGPQRFEVGEEVYSCFLEQNATNKNAFSQKTSTTWLADIYELARIQLRSLGVSDIYGGEYCTVSQETDFFSYRRDGGKTGRMASLIWLAAK